MYASWSSSSARVLEYLSCLRQHHRVAERAAAGQDRHLLHRVGAGQRGRDQGMPALVVGGDELLPLVHQPAALLRTRDDAVDGFVEVFVGDHPGVLPRGQQSGFVEDVGQVGAGEPGRTPGHGLEVDVRSHRLAFGVHPQDREPALHVRGVDGDLPVEPARPEQGRVEHIGPVGGGDQDHAAAYVEAVHLDQQLVEGLLALVVAAAHTGAAMPADGVDLVDEDDGRRVLLGLFEEVADPGGTDTDEHLDEVRSGDGEERHTRLAGDRAGEQRLAGAGWPVQQHTLGDLGADRLELRRLGQELLDLLELLDRLFATGDVSERRLRGVLVGDLGLGLAELHDPAAAALDGVEQEEEEDADDDERDQGAEQRGEEAGSGVLTLPAVERLGGDALVEAGDQLDRSGCRPRSLCSRFCSRPSW